MPAAKWARIKVWVDRPANRRKVLLGTIVLAVVAAVAVDILLHQSSMRWLQDFIKQSGLVGDVFFPASPPDWKDKLTALLPIIGLPVAFWLWHWRDRNVQDQIENARKDVNLKEFQDVQLRAAGALGHDISEEARRQLQIAALQQLRGFIRGDYGESFRRPAFELLLSGHATAMEKLGTHLVSKWVRTDGRFSAKVRREVEKAISQLRDNLDAVSRERIWIIKDDWDILVSTGFPLHHRNFDLIDLQSASFKGLALYHSSFVGAWLGSSDFRNSKIWSSDFIGANMIDCKFAGAVLSSCHCEGADFSLSQFGDAAAHLTNFRGAILRGCDMTETHIEKANFENADINGLKLCGEDEQYVNPDFLAKISSEGIKIFSEMYVSDRKLAREDRDRLESVLGNFPNPSDYDGKKETEIWNKLYERGAKKSLWMK